MTKQYLIYYHKNRGKGPWVKVMQFSFMIKGKKVYSKKQKNYFECGEENIVSSITSSFKQHKNLRAIIKKFPRNITT